MKLELVIINKNEAKIIPVLSEEEENFYRELSIEENISFEKLLNEEIKLYLHNLI